MLSRYGLAESVEELEAEYAGFFKMLYTYGEGPKKVDLYSEQEQGREHDPQLLIISNHNILLTTTHDNPRFQKRTHGTRETFFPAAGVRRKVRKWREVESMRRQCRRR